MERFNLFMDIGIDAMGFSVPRNTFRLKELAHARKTDPEKYEVGLFAHEMRIADFGEDIISLSFSAACEAFTNGNISRDSINAVFVGTETITYAVKSVATILKDMLNLRQDVFTQDIYNACAAGTLAVLNAIGMISCGIIKNALVLCADISQYEMGSAGEPTQGAGAVALVICRNPRIAVFSSEFGKISSNINDFFRFAGKSTPEVYGKYSIDAYIALQTKVFQDLLTKTDIKFEEIDHFIFHAPFAKLPVKLMRKIFEHVFLTGSPNSLVNSLLTMKIKFNRKDFPSSMINSHVLEKGYECIADGELLNAIENRVKEINQSNTDYSKALETILRTNLKDFIQQRILYPLQIPSVVGNMYSASVWAQLYYILVSNSRAGDKIYFGSYGSGATCISGLLLVCNNAPKDLSSYKKIEAILQNKRYITFETYLNLRNCVSLDSFMPESKNNFTWSKIVPLNGKKSADQDFISLNYCNQLCLLSHLHPVDCCPEHFNNTRFKFPLMGEIIEIQGNGDVDFAKMKEGWVLIENDQNIHLHSIVELSFLRWDRNLGIRNCYQDQQSIFNWIPVYRLSMVDTGSSISMTQSNQSIKDCANIENDIKEVNPSVC